MYRFLHECITDPAVATSVQPKDPQCEIVLSILPPNKEVISILDYGCGEGRLVDFFSQTDSAIAKKINYVGYDLNPSNLTALRKKYCQHPFRSCEFNQQPRENFFDRILCCNVIHEIPFFSELSKASKKWKEHLGENGQLIIIENSELRIGEINFLLFDEQELQILFGDGEGFRSKNDDRIFCVAWDKNALRVPEEVTYRKAITMAKNRAYKNLNEITDEKKNGLSGDGMARASRRYGFYLALYANAAMRETQFS